MYPISVFFHHPTPHRRRKKNKGKRGIDKKQKENQRWRGYELIL
jgi:hypothetical protein